MELVEDFIESLRAASIHVGGLHLNLWVIFRGLFGVLMVVAITSRVLRALDRRLMRIHTLPASSRTLVIKVLSIFSYLVAFAVAMQMLGISLAALSVFSGALGVGIGFGLQKVASNFISGIILLSERSVEIDDLVEMPDGAMGFVRETRARYTRLEMLDGRAVLIPNEEFISQRVVNWTHGSPRARVEIVLQVSYGSDLRLARQLMLDAAFTYPGRLREVDVACFVSQFADSGVELKLYFWIADIRNGRMEPKNDVMLRIKDAFDKHGISIPFPQREVRLLQDVAAAPAHKASREAV